MCDNGRVSGCRWRVSANILNKQLRTADRLKIFTLNSSNSLTSDIVAPKYPGTWMLFQKNNHTTQYNLPGTVCMAGTQITTQGGKMCGTVTPPSADC